METNGQAIELRRGEGGSLTQRTLEFTPEQRQMIRNSFASGANESEFAVLMEVARARNLNPLLGQIHFVKRWTQERGEVWSHQVSIDGFRAIAERTGKYDGQDEPEFEYDEGARNPKLARVRVYRKDWKRPAVGVAHFTEYAQYKKDGSLTRMWATKPHIMLAKCAEALAFRKAFPEDTSGLYAPEEMDDESAPPTSTKPDAVEVEYVDDTGAKVSAVIEAFNKKILAAKNETALSAVVAELAAQPAVVKDGTRETFKAHRKALKDRAKKVTEELAHDANEAEAREPGEEG